MTLLTAAVIALIAAGVGGSVGAGVAVLWLEHRHRSCEARVKVLEALIEDMVKGAGES